MSEDFNVSSSSSPTSEATPAPATSGAPAAPATQATPQAPAAATPQAATTGTQTPQDTNRDGWVPSYRLREAREQAERAIQQQFQTREAQLQGELDRINRQLQALVGVQPPQNPEVDNIRKQFSQVFPGLAKLEERFGDVESLIAKAGDLETQTNHYWQQYGQQQMEKLFSLAEQSLGTPLNEEGKRGLHSAFVGWVQSSPSITAEYASNPKLVEEYWKNFASSFIDPVRRVAAAGVSQRAAGVPLPQDRGGAVPPVSQAPKPKDIDERASLAWQQYQTTAKG